jgi:hypothetical protein
MEELLKACQRIHYALVLVALAILIVALSPDIASHYRSASKDLNAFIEMDEHKYEIFRFLAEKHPKFNEIYSIILDIAHESDISIPQKGFELRLLPTNWDHPRGEMKPIEGGMKSVLTIHSLEKFLSSPRFDADTVDPDIDELRVASKRVFDRMATGRPLLQGVDLRSADIFSTSSDTINIVLQFAFLQEVKGRSFNHFEKETVRGRKIQLQKSNFLDWLKTRDEFKYLHDRIAYGHMFAGLDAIWMQISHEDPVEAGQILEKQIATMDESVSFLGIKIPRTIGLIVGPTLCLGALIYLIGYILHILNVLERDSDESTRAFNLFSWVAVFPESINLAVTLTSLWLLPTAANYILLIQMWSSNSSIEKILSLAITISTFAAGLYIWTLLRKVKARANAPKIGPALEEAG